jgi:ATP-dependent RNA helicase DOB1
MSFLQFQAQARIPTLLAQQQDLQAQLSHKSIDGEQAAAEAFEAGQLCEQLKEQLRGLVVKPGIVLEYLRIGRAVRVKHRGVDWGWGLVVNWSSRKSRRREDELCPKEYVVDIVVHVHPLKHGVDPKPAALHEEGVIMVIPFVLEAIL